MLPCKPRLCVPLAVEAMLESEVLDRVAWRASPGESSHGALERVGLLLGGDMQARLSSLGEPGAKISGDLGEQIEGDVWNAGAPLGGPRALNGAAAGVRRLGPLTIARFSRECVA